MRIPHLASVAFSVAGLLLTYQAPTLAAETCPIYNDISEQVEPVPTLTTWTLSDAPTGTIRTADPDGLVNIRAGAGTGFSIVGTARPTASVKMMAHSLSTDCQSWLRVQFDDDRVGWVHGDYVRSDRGFGLFS